ncbi:translocating chain-associated membrane protein 1-like 1 [Rhopilema esculentum]|uniref:translocating chain-associated membrane protein 1-like 1 n=1 Tax=Rhopilema esculentum TaxID=499914 RepID=UPI0031DDF57A|eukprot:gene8338-14304_t
MPLRRKGKSPPFLSQEFFIQNHGDIASCFCMVFLIGLMLQATRNAASLFIAVQHNVTQNANDSTDASAALNVLYNNGWKDLCGIFFQMLCWIVVQAVIQEYVLDKVNRKLHMSKTKTSKFNDSGNMLPIFIASIGVGIDLIMKENLIPKIQSLWTGYPHTEMSFMLKLFFMLQVAYWLHMFPELYFMKTRKEEIPQKVTHYSLYMVFISAAYVMNFTRIALVLLVVHYIPEVVFHASRILHCLGMFEIAQYGFTVWSILFVPARLITITLSILTFWFGLGKADQSAFSIASGNFNNPTFRLACLLAVILVQAWMAWNFITFQVKRYRERSAVTQKKSRQDQKKKGKKEKKSKDDGDAVQNGSPKPRLKED